MRKYMPPFLLGETEWPDAITSGDLLFHIPVQMYSIGDRPVDIAGNFTGVNISKLYAQSGTGKAVFKLVYPPAGSLRIAMDTVNLALDELFWDDTTKTVKEIATEDLGVNYQGKNLLFQCTTGEPWQDLILFTTPRTSSTNPSIEQVTAYLQLTPEDILAFDGEEFIFGGRPIRF